jgi:hypothetical protein
MLLVIMTDGQSRRHLTLIHPITVHLHLFVPTGYSEGIVFLLGGLLGGLLIRISFQKKVALTLGTCRNLEFYTYLRDLRNRLRHGPVRLFLSRGFNINLFGSTFRAIWLRRTLGSVGFRRTRGTDWFRAFRSVGLRRTFRYRRTFRCRERLWIWAHWFGVRTHWSWVWARCWSFWYPWWR